MTLLLWLTLQVFGPAQPVIDISWITQGLPATFIIADVYPSRPGSELVIWIPQAWMVTTAVQHPTRSGYAGMVPAPGICYEPWRGLGVITPGQWHIREVGDVTGDGRADWVFYTEAGLIQVYPSQPGYCE
jgi:hypothetical protein